MNSRERLTRCYSNREIDRPGIYSRTNYTVGDSSYDILRKYLAERSDLKFVWDARILERVKIKTEQYYEKYDEDYDRFVRLLHTPRGTLRASNLKNLKVPELSEPLQERYFINSREDAEEYLSIPNSSVEGEIKSFFEMDRGVGEKGITYVYLGLNPAGYVAALLGTENFAIMSITDRDIIHELCKKRIDIMLEIVKYLLDRNVGPFYSMLGEEYVAPPIHGLADFYDFNARYDKPIIDLIHNAGGYIHIHCHGKIKTVLDEFLKMNVNVLHPFEAPPMGDITPKEAKEKIRDRMCFEGNIQISDMYKKTPEEIANETQALIEDVFDDGKGLIVCPSATPFYYGKAKDCFLQYKAMIETVLAYKK